VKWKRERASGVDGKRWKIQTVKCFSITTFSVVVVVAFAAAIYEGKKGKERKTSSCMKSFENCKIKIGKIIIFRADAAAAQQQQHNISL